MSLLRPLVEDLAARRETIKQGGGPEKIEAQHNKGALTARERIELLIDAGTFVELGIHGRPHFSQRAMEGREAPADGVITGYGPEVDPAALGYEVTAFVTLEIRQAGGHDPVAERLAAIPEVLEVHTITGAGDMLCRVVARSNADLQRVIDAIVSAEGVVRSATLISLATQVPYRVLPLVRAAAVS